MTELPRRLLECLRRAGHGGAVVALSGGPDSVALLHALIRAGVPRKTLLAAHLDHALRPDSREDAEFARCIALEAGVAFRADRIDVAAHRRSGGPGLEAVARDLRYRFLESTARDAGLPVVATGHHRDDQAETVLLRILRGTGPAGLSAIRPSRPIREGSPVLLVRPLLGLSRAEILAWLRRRGLSFREDPTNRDGSNLRSRVRTRLLPDLEAALPGLSGRLAAVVPLAARIPAPPPGVPSREIPLTRDLLRVRSRLRAEILRRLPPGGPALDRAAMERISRVLDKGNGDAELGGGYRARVRRGTIRLIRPDRPELALPAPVRFAPPGGITLSDGRRLRVEPVRDPSLPAGPESEIVDADRVTAPLTLRSARAGDRFRPLGYPAETSIFRFLMGQHVPREDRPGTLLLSSPEGPVWLVGHRIAHEVRVRQETQRGWRLSIDG